MYHVHLESDDDGKVIAKVEPQQALSLGHLPYTCPSVAPAPSPRRDGAVGEAG